MQHRPLMLTRSSKGCSNDRRTGMSIQDVADDLVFRLDELLVQGKRFVMLKKGESIPAKKAKHLWGVIRNWPRHGRIIAVDLKHLRILVSPAAILPSVLRFLMRKQIVLPGIDGTLTRQLMIGGLRGSERRRYVVFVEKALVERAGIIAATPRAQITASQ
jgi:hypothetical protein